MINQNVLRGQCCIAADRRGRFAYRYLFHPQPLSLYGLFPEEWTIETDASCCRIETTTGGVSVPGWQNERERAEQSMQAEQADDVQAYEDDGMKRAPALVSRRGIYRLLKWLVRKNAILFRN